MSHGNVIIIEHFILPAILSVIIVLYWYSCLYIYSIAAINEMAKKVCAATVEVSKVVLHDMAIHKVLDNSMHTSMGLGFSHLSRINAHAARNATDLSLNPDTAKTN